MTRLGAFTNTCSKSTTGSFEVSHLQFNCHIHGPQGTQIIHMLKCSLQLPGAEAKRPPQLHPHMLSAVDLQQGTMRFCDSLACIK